MTNNTKLYSVIIAISFFLISFFSGPPAAISDFQRTKIAVLDFELIGDKNETVGMGAMISEWFITSIVKTGRFEVVERALLQKILEEQKLSATGVIDRSSASQIGNVLGVKALITGSVLKFKKTIEINSRVINVESGSIITAESIRSDSESDLRSPIELLTAKIIANFPLTGYIVKKTSQAATIDLGLSSGLTVGTEFIVYKEGDVVKHPKTGEILDITKITTGRLRVIKISNSIAESNILNEENGGVEYGHQVKSISSPKVISESTENKKSISNILPTTSLTDQKSSSNTKRFKEAKKTKNGKNKFKSVQSIFMDEYDKKRVNKVLEYECSGTYTHWLNPITGNLFNVVPKPAFYHKEKPTLPCRKITISVNSPVGISESKTVAFCRNKNGEWTVQ